MIKSFCKINLSLRVLKRLKNGMHNIQSNSVLLNFYDEIKIEVIKNKTDLIIFNGKFGKEINITKNSVIKTMKLLRSKGFINKKVYYKILVNKKIPIFSGLGGGTSNAAFLIKNFIKGKISKKLMNLFADRLGSDLRLFFFDQLFQKNLKTIIKYKKKFNLHFVIIFPNIKCSTKKIYSGVKNFSRPSKINFETITYKPKFIELIKKDKNDLQFISSKNYPVIKKIINYLSDQKGCLISRMTGSGSACYGMFKSQKLAKLGLNSIKKKFPNYWGVVTKTI